MHRNRLQLIACIVSILFVFGFGEAAIRVLGRADEDGNFTFSGRRVQPYRLPVARVAAAVRRYAESKDAMIAYDSQLGWTPRPGASNDESIHNSAGLRVESADRSADVPVTPESLRIALFGDSFVYGSEVKYADTWAAGLTRLLAANGNAVEVLNFGVPGYGTDQAFLRWLQTGSRYTPDLVIFGLQLENMHRNVNLVRAFYIPVVDLPFSKPRFVTRQGRSELINRPPVPPERLPGLIAQFDRWDLHQDEAFYKPERYESKWWSYSRLLGFVVPAVLERTGAVPRDDQLTEAKQELAFKILSDFARSVDSQGARFQILHLPTRSDLQTLSSTGKPPLAEFLERVRARFGLIDPSDDLVRRANDVSMAALFRPGGHYTVDGNAVVADVLARQVDLKRR